MSKWFYLQHKSLQVRNLIAAHYCKDYNYIVEIGGFFNPITNFIDNNKHITIIDPLFESTIINNNLHKISDKYENCNIPKDKYALICLGLDLPQTNIQKFLEWFNRASMCILECAVEFHPSILLINIVEENTFKSKILDLIIDYNNNDISVPFDSYPPFLKRRILIWENNDSL